MSRKTTFLAAGIFAGTAGMAANAAWSQQTPGSMPQSPSQQQREQTQPWQTEPSQPGATQGMPGMPGATQELSKNDMQAVQQALKDKGYDVTVNGTADESTRAAIRKFQQDEGLPITGMIDERTANQLGFQVRSQSPSGTSTPGATDRPGYPGAATQPDSPGLPGPGGQPGSSERPSPYR